MGSSFSTSNNTSPKYDAFLSFRGVDTRNGFRSHLKSALREKGIKTFTDDENMEVGEDVPPQLLQAIKESKSSIAILSPGYASSKWCLNELVQILDCMKTMGQIVAPIFYGVRRSDVRDLTGVFGDGFSQRDQDSDSQRWREALRYVAKLPGNELQDGYV